MSQILFEDTIGIKSLNDAGKKFERVDRLHGRSKNYDMEFVLDVNSELFVCHPEDNLHILLASSLSGSVDDNTYNPNDVNSPLAENFDYIMHGRVFSIKHIEGQRIELQASFGGLLFRLRGEQASLDKFVVDNTFFILARNLGGSGL
jgi:DNA-directed RNA polymerase I, II, and III subunit RPABC3